MTPAPLARTLSRGAARGHAGCDLGATLDTAGGSGTRLLELGDHQLKGVLAAVGRQVGTSRGDVQGSLLVEAYAWTLLLPLAGALVAEARVPRLDEAAPAVRLQGGAWPRRLILSDPRFHCLPSDPDRTDPHAREAAGEGPLVAHLAEGVTGHLDPLLRRLAGVSGRGERALWRSAADRTAAAFL